MTWQTAFLTLQEGLDRVASSLAGSVILLGPGVYTPTAAYPPSSTDPRSVAFALPVEGTEIRGGYLGYDNGNIGDTSPQTPDGLRRNTILSGNLGGGVFAFHVVVADQLGGLTSSEIVNLIIREGRATEPGTFNQDQGGGLFNRSSRTLVEDVVFHDNEAILGGAVYGIGAEFLSLKRTVIRSNHATAGAGVYMDDASMLQAANLRITQNGTTGKAGVTNTNRGGGMYFGSEIVSICSNMLIHANQAGEGGAVYIEREAPQDQNSYIWRQITITNNNTGPFGGNNNGGIFVEAGPAQIQFFLLNSILWDNGVDFFSAGTTGPNDTIGAFASDIGVSVGLVLDPLCISQDPLFISPSSENYRLQNSVFSHSPCVDAAPLPGIGDDFLDIDEDPLTTALPLDLNLNPRVVDQPLLTSPLPVDMGAFEAPSVDISPF